MGKSSGAEKNNLGKWGENQAAKYLKEKGYQLCESNVRTPYGEIDLVVKKSRAFIFVEVKTRRTKQFGNPEEAVTREKLTHMIESAESYLQERTEQDIDWQIDVIAVQLKKDNHFEIQHFENIAE